MLINLGFPGNWVRQNVRTESPSLDAPPPQFEPMRKSASDVSIQPVGVRVIFGPTRISSVLLEDGVHIRVNKTDKIVAVLTLGRSLPVLEGARCRNAGADESRNKQADMHTLCEAQSDAAWFDEIPCDPRPHVNDLPR